MPASACRLCLVLTILGAAAVTLAATEERTDLKTVLARAGAYAVRYGESMASVVADEDYTQRLVDTASQRVVAERHLQSELAFVRLSGSTDWLAFRDVQAVDGRPLPHEVGRLLRLFRETPDSALAQAQAIAAAGARYNLGPLQRTFNAPTMTLQLLHPDHQDRFRFRHGGTEACGDEPCWRLDFRERRQHTLIRTPEGRDVPLEGTLWVEPGSGRLVRAACELSRFLDGSRDDRSRGRMDVTWVANPHVGEWVPAGMRENYEGLPGPEGPSGTVRTLTGVATYANFRRFAVDYRIR